MIQYVVGGIPVNDETLAVDVTKEVGSFKDFLSHPATFKHNAHPVPSPASSIDRVSSDGKRQGPGIYTM